MLEPQPKGSVGNEKPETLPFPLLCLVTDRRQVPEGMLADRVAKAVAGGVGMVQLREKDLPEASLLKLAKEIRASCEGRTLLVVNSNVKVAIEAHANGIHLPENGVAIAKVRRLVGPGLLIGRSVHGVEAATRAEQEGADYLFVGTMFETASKAGKEPEGPSLLKKVAGAVRIPLLGIGGITARNVDEVMRADADGAAVISAILAAPDPGQAAQDLMMAMVGARSESAARPTVITLVVNGKKESLDRPTALTDFLKGRIHVEARVAVGRNGNVVHRGDWSKVILKDGDVLDIVHMVGGG